MKEVKKGNKIPYHGYLLNMTEYHKIKKMQEAFPLLVDYYQTSKEKYTNKRLH